MGEDRNEVVDNGLLIETCVYLVPYLPSPRSAMASAKGNNHNSGFQSFLFHAFLLYLQSSHQPKKLDTSNLQRVASLSNMQAFDVTVDPILVPRVVGTANHAKVKQYIIDQMKSFGWDTETDKFSDNTPLGRKEFENIIATLDPNARRRLVLACHYDSKFSKDDAFIGATDSAVPCAMMITLARDLAPQLDALKQRVGHPSIS